MIAIKSPKEMISRCVDEFEARTQVELVLLIKKGSQSYFSFFWFYTLLFVQIFWASTLLWNENFVFEILILESLALIGLSYLLLMRLELLKHLIPRKTKRVHFQRTVAQEFYNLGMYNTKKRSGLLIIFSQWENECQIIADKGVQEKISKEELETFTLQFQKAFNEKDLVESLGSQIRTFGVFWHSKWPNEDDENEIVFSFKDDLK